MKFYAPTSLPIYLAPPVPTEPQPPVIKFFDVYYTMFPVVGFHAVGESSATEGASFVAFSPPPDDDGVVGLVIDEDVPPPPGVAGFCPQAPEPIQGPGDEKFEEVD